ncbi:MAG: anhydro-N-acetylmuramic acid kinase [Rhizobiaceae bacterium]|nr:anhydro-N-acetylmuramic acid kinase [Rhizobiaceae bacterium]
MMRDGLQTAIGLMSGTSMDGIDVAMLTTDGVDRLEFHANLFVPYDPAFRHRLEAALQTAKLITRREERPGDLSDIETELSDRHAYAVETFLAQHGVERDDVDLIGFHGQTVLHRPAQALTVQLGDGSRLARRTHIPVVFDMRANDVQNNGQGAPLVPAYHAALARSRRENFAGKFPVCFVNIGGISNITYVPEEGDPIAFDTGPGNALIDQWVSREGGIPYDAGGAIASEGGVIQAVVDRYLASSFFDKAGPKSLDRNDFTLAEVTGLELADGARTLASVSAGAIMRSVEHLPEPPKLWVLCGGGRKNPHIVGDMRDAALGMGAELALAEDVGLNGDFTEAEAWGYLAVRSVLDLPLTYPTTTGCKHAVSGGILARPAGNGG